MKVQEIFLSIQGEGLTSGAPTMFIRFGGCSLHCQECDTEYAQDTSSMTDLGVPFIIDKIVDMCPRPRFICITGGEPLEQPQTEMFNLLQTLQGWYGTRGLEAIILETNGAQSIAWISEIPARKVVRFSIDFKTPSTGAEEKMIFGNFKDLTPQDTIKFICKDMNDIKFAGSVLQELSTHNTCRARVWFHMTGGVPDRGLAQEILKWDSLNERFDIRVGVQLHKLFQLR